MHLWEVDHAYYCNHGNYFTNESCTTHYKTWAEILRRLARRRS
jgi:hypothetical protein